MILTSAQVAVTNSYSRDLEREADKEAEDFHPGGYLPSAMVTSLEAMIHDQLKRPYVDSGSLHDPSRADRKSGIHRPGGKDAGFPIRRKKALNLLRSSIRENDDGTICLSSSMKRRFGPSPGSRTVKSCSPPLPKKSTSISRWRLLPMKYRLFQLKKRTPDRSVDRSPRTPRFLKAPEPLDAMRSAIVALRGSLAETPGRKIPPLIF